MAGAVWACPALRSDAAAAGSDGAAAMASQSQGIQQLLQAEKRAAEKVAEARKSEYGTARFLQAPPRRVWW